MMLVAAQELHAPFILDLRNQERKRRFLSGVSRTLADQIAWMKHRATLPNDAYFVVYEIAHAIQETASVRVGSWVMTDGVAPKKTLVALALALEYAVQSGLRNFHFEVHKKSLSALKLYIKLGSEILGESEETLLLHCSLIDFLKNMSTVYHVPSHHILQITL